MIKKIYYVKAELPVFEALFLFELFLVSEKNEAKLSESKTY